MDLNQLTPVIYTFFLVWLATLTLLYARLIKHYNSFTQKTKKKDLVASLNELLKNTHTNHTDIKAVNKRLDKEIEKARKHLKKLSFKRYNPFTDTGGDQSFILSILDENNDGIVLSSLHSRENTRIYAKRIEAGKSSDQVLSKDEKEVVNRATK